MGFVRSRIGYCGNFKMQDMEVFILISRDFSLVEFYFFRLQRIRPTHFLITKCNRSSVNEKI